MRGKLEIRCSVVLTLLIAFMLIHRSNQVKAMHAAIDLPQGRYFIKSGKFYLAVNNPVESNGDEYAFFGTRDYIQAAAVRYSKEVWIKKVINGSGFHIMSKFGQQDSYLCVDGLVSSGSYQDALFATKQYINESDTDHQNSFWVYDMQDYYHLYVTQQYKSSRLSFEDYSGEYDWAYFFAYNYPYLKYDKLKFVKLEDNHVDYCQAIDKLEGNSAAFYMTSDPQFRFGSYGNGGRTDGDDNAKNTYTYLKTQVNQPGCPQSFIGIAGDLNHEWTDWQTNFFNSYEPITKKKFVADILGNHDLVRLPNNSMVQKLPSQFTSDLFYWGDAVRAKYPYRATTFFTNYSQTVYNQPNTPATFYTLELRSKSNPTSLAAYVIMIHNQLWRNVWYLNYVSSQPDFNKAVPIILVAHAVNGYPNELSTWIQNNRVAVILTGHVFCGDAYHNDHCDRRSDPTLLQTDITFGSKTIKNINTSGVRDRVFWSVSINNQKVVLRRKVWTNSQRLPGFETLYNPPITINIPKV